MSGGLREVRAELRPMLRLALPLVLAEVGWMLMGLVDTVMVGRVPDAAVAIGAVALAQVLFNTMAIGLGCILLALDTVVAQAHGAGEIEEAGQWFVQGLLLAAALGVVLVAGLLLAPMGMRHMRASPAVVAEAIRTLRALTVGVLPLMLYFALRRQLQAFNHVRWIAAALLSANVVNLFFDWLLIFPHGAANGAAGGFWRGWGAVGSGVATSLARVYLAAFLMGAVGWLNRRHGYGLGRVRRRVNWAKQRELLRLGLPIGGTVVVEILVFAAVTVLISTISAQALAGHEVALNCVSFTFMVPLGLSAAASVRVGQAVGRGDGRGAAAAGWAALVVAGGFMLGSSLLFELAPHAIARGFTPDAGVIAATVPIFAVAAFFQFFDGLQVTALGALRGMGDTRSGFVTHLCTYWVLGMPLGWWLAFRRGWGAPGLWVGICVALIVAGTVLVVRWSVVSRATRREMATGG